MFPLQFRTARTATAWRIRITRENTVKIQPDEGLTMKQKRRRSKPFIMRWMSLLVASAGFRSVWNLIIFNQHSPTVRDFAIPRPMDIPLPPSKPSLRKSVQKNPRQKRPPTLSWDLQEDVPPTHGGISHNTIVQSAQHLNQFKEDTELWKYLCNGATQSPTLSSGSRVFISGILTHTIASELALALADRCGVETIFGLIEHDPDDHDMAPRLSFLVRRVQGFQFQQRDLPLTQEAIDHIVSSVKPTHIIRFESNNFLPAASLEEIPTMFSFRGSVDHLERLLIAVTKFQQQHSRSDRVRVLYVSSTPESRPHARQPNTMDIVYQLLLQTFRVHYGIDAVHIRLPKLYGPFMESAVHPNDLLFGLPPTDESTNCIHVDDAVQSLTASLTHDIEDAGSSFTVIKPPEDYATSFERLRYSVQNANITGSKEKLENERSNMMLSWYHQEMYPFEDTATVHGNSSQRAFRKALAKTNRRLDSNRTSAISQFQRRQNRLFPCNSECAVNSPCSETSAFSPLVPLIQNITDSCRFVVYTTHFSSQLADIMPMEENTRANISFPRDLLCRVAFVSGKSTLVKSLLKAEKSLNSSIADNELNGRLYHNKWLLLWLPQDDSNLNEADYVLPKIAPGALFSNNVTKCMHVDPLRIGGLPPLAVIWFLLNKRLDAGKQEAKTKHSFVKGTTIRKSVPIGGTPPRHVVLFSHSLGSPTELAGSEDMDAVAKYLLYRQGREPTSAWPSRQLTFYDFAHTHYDFKLVDTFLIIHNLKSDRGRRLRCEWYEEHLFWADDTDHRNRHLEDLSLAYRLAKWRKESRLVANEEYRDDWGERIVDPTKGDVLNVDVNGTFAPSQYFVKLHDIAASKRT